MKQRCIVFDLDDTLYLEQEYVRSGFAAVGLWASKQLDVPDFAAQAWDLFQRGARRAIFQSLLLKNGRDADASVLAQMTGIYRNHLPEISLAPDAACCLARMREKRPTGIITDGCTVRQMAKIASLGLSSLGNNIVCTGQWGELFFKPHERAFRLLQQQMGYDCSFTYIADNPLKDFQAPIALGWATIRIRRAEGLHYSKESLPEYKPDLELADMWDLADIIENAPVRGSVMSARPSYG